ncbi:MAG: hypothetical protein DRP09_14080 [Candidatus Thorarchaeota archaeon]|nr:MAG: hypothetical protein DRP09_14080 [Candidatus Thorarchaeota archaeon]
MKKVNDMNEREFAEFFQTLRVKILEDPIRFFVKSPKFLDTTPTPGQTILLKSVFGQKLDPVTKYKVAIRDRSAEDFQLIDSNLTEVELYKLMTEFDYVENDKKYNRINLICGRRSGKSLFASIIALFSAIKVNWKPYLKKHPVATIAVLSHSVDFSQEILDVLKDLVGASPILSRLKDKSRKDAQTVFHLKVPFFVMKNGKEIIEYSKVAVKVGAASKKTTRGRATCTVLMDEVAYWNLADHAVESDVDILRAIRPALFQFGDEGTIIKLSSPGIKQGVLYDEWIRKEELRDEYVQLKAPSWVMNTILPRKEFYNEFRLDPDGFQTEFEAEFVDSISNFIISEFVDSCILKGVRFIPPLDNPNTVYSAAIDAAFKGDRFAFTLVGHCEHKITTNVVKYWEGSKKRPVRVNEVAQYIQTMCRQFGITEVVADQFAYQPMREIFEEYGIELVENVFSIQYKRKIYFALKRIIHNLNIDLVDIPLLAKEIKELVVEQTPTGQIKIGHPQTGSDDLADALAVACYTALEKVGSMGLTQPQVAHTNPHNIVTDVNGVAFTAPHPTMLLDHQGFAGVEDNSGEYRKDPETGKYRKISELEGDEDVTGGGGGPDFIF